jgi:hypothetical protein
MNKKFSFLAHQLWQERGRAEGSPDQDWFEAERQTSLKDTLELNCSLGLRTTTKLSHR